MTNSSQGMAGSKRIPVMRPWGTALRTVVPWIMPSSTMSSTYSERPVTLSVPSLRGMLWPTYLPMSPPRGALARPTSAPCAPTRVADEGTGVNASRSRAHVATSTTTARSATR